MQRSNYGHELVERVCDDGILLDVVVRDIRLGIEQPAQGSDVVCLHRVEVGGNRASHFSRCSESELETIDSYGGCYLLVSLFSIRDTGADNAEVPELAYGK